MSLLTPDGGLLFWMVLIFGIVLFVLAKWGFPVITDAVEKRTEGIQKALQQAEEAEKKLLNLASEQQEILLQTRKEREAMLQQASEDGAKIIEKAKQEAGKEAEKMMAEAHAEIEQEKENALRDIRRQVALLSMGVAEKILRKELSKDGAMEKYAEESFEEMKKAEMLSGK